MKKISLIRNNNKIKIFLILYFILSLTEGEVKIMYFVSNNLGDNLNNILLKKMIYKKKIVFLNSQNEKNISLIDKVKRTDFFFIGSILETISNLSYIFNSEVNKYKNYISKWYFIIYDYLKPLIIFGSGFISETNKNESYVRNIKILAVRGNITLQRLKNNGIKISKDVVLADPALLTPLILNVNNKTNNSKKIYELCIIPHYIDKTNSLIKKKIKISNSFILNINENPYKFIDNLLKCKRVLSSSLHGLIISDSFGIPNMQLIVSDKIVGGDYKFKDYYSSFGINYNLKFDLREMTFSFHHILLIEHNYKISPEMIEKKQCQLLIRFPYRLNKQLYLIKKLCLSSFL